MAVAALLLLLLLLLLLQLQLMDALLLFAEVHLEFDDDRLVGRRVVDVDVGAGVQRRRRRPTGAALPAAVLFLFPKNK